MTRLFPQEEPPPEVRQTLEGVVERIVYSHPDSGWTVLKITRVGGSAKASVVGRLPGLQPGETVRFSGRWKLDRKYGRQFDAAVLPVRRAVALRHVGSLLHPGSRPACTPKRGILHVAYRLAALVRSARRTRLR